MSDDGFTPLSNIIVKAVLDDLSDRAGVGDELEGVEHNDPDVYAELVATLEGKVSDLLLACVVLPT